jgi:NADPH:quinone reductase-like Zn-dependent oxidoreductase
MDTPATMKAWTCRRYGGPEVLALETLPLLPLGPGEVRIRVRATTVSSGDARVRALRLPPGFGILGPLILGFRGPRRPVLGTEVSGVVEAVGSEVLTFRPGDAVIAFPDTKMGGHADYVTLRAKGLIVKKPSSLSFEAAASLCFGGLTAIHYMRKAMLKAGERLLVIGASGAVGSAFVQLARHRGAHVTAVTSTGNMELVQALGAHAAVDYTHEDFTALGHRWDVIADTVAASSFKRCLPALNEAGRYLAIAGGVADMLIRKNGSRRSISGPAQSRGDDLRDLAHLAQEGAYKPLIDSIFPFEAMREAHARTDTGRKRGSVVVRIENA